MDHELTPDYGNMFEGYIAQSVQTTLRSIPADAHYLAQEERDRVMHVLNYALTTAFTWPLARDLILRTAAKMEQAGHRGDWMDYLEDALAYSRWHEDELATAEIQWHIGHLLRLQSQFGPARQALEASAAVFATLDHKHGQARTWNELGYLAWHQQQFAEAQQCAEAALAVLPVDDPERAGALAVLGGVAVSQQQWQHGEEIFREALQIHRQSGSKQRIAWTMQHLGYVLYCEKEHAEAIHFYEAALQLLTEIQDVRNCGIVQMSLGMVYWNLQQLDRTLELYESAEAMFRKTHDPLYLAKTVNNKGLVFLDLQEWQRAKDAFTVSVALYQDLNDSYGLINSLDGLGLACCGLASFDEAVVVFASALERIDEIQEHPMYQKLKGDLTA
ncbi:MAG: tetratricopeptide repeat protein, partial [Caldilineaceae bacterium]|nr:tetratricopeptide repeat protein [Caldilineaceae bacterium]